MLKRSQMLGKYRIERRIAEGPYAAVYQAYDTIEGIRVALKLAHPHLATSEFLEDFRHEVRLTAQLDDPAILPVKNASFIDNHFVIVLPLGQGTLAERLRKRLATKTALMLIEQMLQAVAAAHHHRIIHCDIKPENFIIFPGNRIRLADFGIAKIAWRTIQASGSGTIGYIAPEQAMGRPSTRSDVFSLGLIIYRMLTGQLPRWPFTWPPPAYDRLTNRAHPHMIDLIRRALEIEPDKRFQDAEKMLAAFRKVRSRALAPARKRQRQSNHKKNSINWEHVRQKQYLRQFGTATESRYTCTTCAGPVAEAMLHCPWCGTHRHKHPDDTRFPRCCPRCNRGLKLDWKYCPWCYGPGFELETTRQYTDVRYQARCHNQKCSRRSLMPFMRYCPWCHRKVRKAWKLPGSNEKCSSCGWGVTATFWNYCPWCGVPIAPVTTRKLST